MNIHVDMQTMNKGILLGHDPSPTHDMHLGCFRLG